MQEKREMVTTLYRGVQRESDRHMVVGTVPERARQQLHDMMYYTVH